MATCRSCEAPIIWATTAAGKHMPLDADPTSDGRWVFPPNGETRQATMDDRRLLRPLHTAHWATCPDAASLRGRR